MKTRKITAWFVVIAMIMTLLPFVAMPVSAAELTIPTAFTVTAPADGASPSTTVTPASGTGWTATAAWFDAAGTNAFSGTFVGSTAYTVKVTLTLTNSGADYWAETGVNENTITINGSAGTHTAINDGVATPVVISRTLTATGGGSTPGGGEEDGDAPAATAKPEWTIYNEIGYEFLRVEGDWAIMYSIGKDAAAVTGEKAKWFYTHNLEQEGYLDISKYIPKKGSAFIGLSYFYNGKLAGTKVSVEIKARDDGKGMKDFAKDFYKDGKFDNTTGKDLFVEIGTKGVTASFYLAKKPATGDNTPHIYEIEPDYFPFGATGTVRYDSIWTGGSMTLSSDTADTDKGEFASAPMKFKVAAQPNAPKGDKMELVAEVPANGNKAAKPAYLKGVNEKMEVLVGTKDSDGSQVWKPLEKNMEAIKFNELFTKPETGVTADGKKTTTTGYEFTIRFKADKKPASAKTTLALTKADYDKATAAPAAALSGVSFANTAATTGQTKITLPTAGEGNSFVYVIGDAEVKDVKEGSTVTSGIAVVSAAEFAVTADKYVTVYEIDADAKVVKFVSTKITAAQIKAAA